MGDFKNLFDFKDKYTLHIPSVNTELKGKNSIRYFGAVIWNAIPFNVKTATSPLMLLRIELNLGNQSALVDSVKPIYKGWALLILQNNLQIFVSTLSFWF